MNAEAAFEGRSALAEYIVSKSDARFRQKLRAIVRQSRIANRGGRVDHAVSEVVIRGAAMSFIPPVRRFEPEAVLVAICGDVVCECVQTVRPPEMPVRSPPA